VLTFVLPWDVCGANAEAMPLLPASRRPPKVAKLLIVIRYSSTVSLGYGSTSLGCDISTGVLIIIVVSRSPC